MPVTVETCRKTERNNVANTVRLSPREQQLARLVTEGQQNKEIAYQLGITEGTVKVYMSHLFAKLGVSNRAELSAWATRNGDLLFDNPQRVQVSPQWFVPDPELGGPARDHLPVRSRPLSADEFSRLASQLMSIPDHNRHRFAVLMWTEEGVRPVL